MSDPTYKALLIGNSTFPNDPHNLQSLEGPVNDISVLRDALSDPQVGLFEPTAVRMLPERTMAEILIELETFFGSAARDDRLLLYYSGHGLLTDENRLLLCARDTRTDVVKATSVSAMAINDMIDSSAAQTTIIVLDCCYSGAFKGAGLPESLKGNGRFLLTSTRSGQLANDATRRNGTSLFTQHLVDGLLNAVPDTNGDGYVELGEIYDYVHARLVSEGRQIPQRSFSGGGGVAVARRPRKLADGESRPSAGFELSQSTIDIDDVAQGETLPPEHVYVLTGAGETCDYSVSTEAEWIRVEPYEGYFSVALHPLPGTNRANVVVRDRNSGATRTMRVRVRVREPEPLVEVATAPESPITRTAHDGIRDGEPDTDPAPDRRRGGGLLGQLRHLTRTRARAILVGLGALIVLFGLVAAIVTLATGGSSTRSSTSPVSGPGPATLYSPTGLAVDPSGAVLVADSGHDRVRRIGPDGGVTTVAGHGGDDPPTVPGSAAVATTSSISGVSTIAVDGSGNLYVALGSDNGIAKVTPGGAASIVPIRVPGGGAPTVSALAVGPDGQLVGAVGNDVFKLGPDGTVTPVAGSGSSGYTGDGGPATSARLNIPKGLAFDRQGQMYIADSGNDRVRLVRTDGTIVTVAGVGSDSPLGDGGPAVAAKVSQPTGLALDDKGNLYLTSGNQLRRVGSDGIITLVAGRADNSSGFYGDNGLASAAALSRPDGIGRDSAGNLYVSDTGNSRVRKITPEGTITTVG